MDWVSLLEAAPRELVLRPASPDGRARGRVCLGSRVDFALESVRWRGGGGELEVEFERIRPAGPRAGVFELSLPRGARGSGTLTLEARDGGGRRHALELGARVGP